MQSRASAKAIIMGYADRQIVRKIEIRASEQIIREVVAQVWAQVGEQVSRKIGSQIKGSILRKINLDSGVSETQRRKPFSQSP